MKNVFASKINAKEIDILLVAIRLVMGIAFILHGWGKIQHPMSWMGPDAAIPGIFQALAAISEFFGGIALIVGVVTKLAALGMAITMVVAAAFHAIILGDPFVSKSGGGSYELATIYLLLSLLFVIIGAGRYSIDQKIFGSK